MVFWMCWQLNLFSQVSTLPLDHTSAPFTSITNQCLFTQINVFFRRRQTFPVHQESKVLGKSHTLTNSSKVKLQLNSCKYSNKQWQYFCNSAETLLVWGQYQNLPEQMPHDWKMGSMCTLMLYTSKILICFLWRSLAMARRQTSACGTAEHASGLIYSFKKPQT